AAICRNDFQEVSDDAGDASLGGNRRDGALLFVRGKDRARDEALEIGALIQQGLKPIEIRADRIDRPSLAGKLEKRGSVAFRYTGNQLGCVSHGHSFPELSSSAEPPRGRFTSP